MFVSHLHMDHFAGFDQLLRLFLYRNRRLTIVGPPGLGDAVDAKLRAYTWNLLDESSHDFSIQSLDWLEEGYVACSQFAARSRFRRQRLPPPDTKLLVDDLEFQIEAAVLDHGIPCLAFAFQEKVRINVHKARLDEVGLKVGPWLNAAKRAARTNATPPSRPPTAAPFRLGGSWRLEH